MYIEFILGIFVCVCVFILVSLPTKSKVKLENVDCILSEKLKDKKFKKLYNKEVKKLTKIEEKIKKKIKQPSCQGEPTIIRPFMTDEECKEEDFINYLKKEQLEREKENKTKKKLLAEGYKELAKPEEVTKSYTSVDEMLDDLHSHRGWTLWDYIVSFWHRYFWNYVSDIPLRVKTFIQRGMRGWSDSDTWSFDFYLAKVISEGVKHLIKYGNSCWTKKDLASLKEIIKTFETANEINEHNLLYTESKKFTWKAYKKQKRTCEFMNKKRSYPRDKKYRVMTLREVLRFEKGFDTFKEKFFYLWD